YFIAWRDLVLDMLGVWHSAYFRHLDPVIFTDLQREADALRARARTEPSLDLVEEATNGIVLEPTPELYAVTLVPQYHHRPYNHHTGLHGGVLILYPC